MSNPIQYVDFSASHAQQRTCLRGHVINHEGVWGDEAPQQWCHHCGAAVISECPECKGPLRGANNYAALPESPKPERFCLHCGKAFPWTQTALAAANEYADELEELTPSEKAELKATFDDLTTDTARTPLATSRFKKLMAKATPEVGKGLMKIVVSILTDEAKKQLGITP